MKTSEKMIEQAKFMAADITKMRSKFQSSKLMGVNPNQIHLINSNFLEQWVYYRWYGNRNMKTELDGKSITLPTRNKLCRETTMSMWGRGNMVPLSY